MNRFRTKKKVKDVVETPVRDTETPPPLKASKTLKWGKKVQEPELKKELDLVNALPSSDDFRTSLLMNNLSARFSMLREQDDPKSKLGKASDDSVLYPKRQSRLNDFGLASKGLADIAEVSSTNGSIRPPFAFGRTDSYHTADGYGTDDDSTYGGSIMNRSKPGEGNNLFGGRQKIYKIPAGGAASSKSLADGGGRALYENDVSQSAFQKIRERERQEKQRREESQEEEQNAQFSRPSSSQLAGYNRNRETSSTTSSGGPSISRTSTAATSVSSQRTPSLNSSRTPNATGPLSGGLERSMTKGRRLYETGLDQHLHEQQFSAMSRIDTLTRQRTFGAQTPPPGLSSSTSASSAGERWDGAEIGRKASLPTFRTASPPSATSSKGNLDFGVKTANLPEAKTTFGLASPPLSPQSCESEDHSVLTTLPNDRGKATAMGAFAKPLQPYDEAKFSQRQLQMHQGRESLPRRKHSPSPAFAPHQQPPSGRARTESNATFASGRSRSNSSAQRQFLPRNRVPESPASPAPLILPEQQSIASGTFLSSPEDSSPQTDVHPRNGVSRPNRSPVNPSSMFPGGRGLNVERPPESEHPAMRHQPFQSNVVPPSSPQPRSIDVPVKPTDSDSPTLGPTTGLSSIVRQHLRSVSNTSSGDERPASSVLASRFPSDPMDSYLSNQYSMKNNPWDLDEWDQESADEENKFNLEVPEIKSKSKEEEESSVVAPENFDHAIQEPRKMSWEKEAESQHTRSGKTETERERENFHNELATRRRQVQENLKSFVEIESRSTSALPGSDWSRDGHSLKHNALGILRAKTSRGSLVLKPKEHGQSKAMRMLGIGSATISSSPSPSKQVFDEHTWKEEEQDNSRGAPPSGNNPQSKAFRQARRDAQRDRERQVAMRHQQQQQRARAETSESEWASSRVNQMRRRYEGGDDRQFQPRQRTPSRERPRAPTNTRNGNSFESKESRSSGRSGSRSASRTARDRSSSDASGGRSKSRNGRYKDDLAKAMAEGTGSTGQSVIEDLHASRYFPKSPAPSAMGFHPSPVPSPMIGSRTPRSGSKDRSTAAGYFDAQKPPPLLINEGMEIGLSPRPSPITPFSVNPTPSLGTLSPALSGANAPTAQGFQSQGRIPEHRKKSINKYNISEPTLISSTSRITTVNLPPGASLQNGLESAPPIPAVNPRRRQTRAMFGLGKKEELSEMHSLPIATQSTEEMSTFSDDGDDKPKARHKLRKSSSEGGNLNARARQAAFQSPSPAVPAFPTGSGSPPRPAGAVDGGMF